jgi:hypothetical protein
MPGGSAESKLKSHTAKRHPRWPVKALIVTFVRALARPGGASSSQVEAAPEPSSVKSEDVPFRARMYF